jgi:chromosome segregation ATPase
MTPEEIVIGSVGTALAGVGAFIRWSLGRELKRKEDDIQANRVEADKIRLSVQELREDMERRADACTALTERYRDQFEKRKADTDGVIAEYRSRMTKLEDRVDNTGPILVDIRQALAANTNAVTNLQAVLERVKEFMDTSKSERSKLWEDVRDHADRISTLGRDVGILKTKAGM